MIEEVERVPSPSGAKPRRFLCQCDCGNLSTVLLGNLRRGDTSSCGCWSAELAANRLASRQSSHGYAKKTPEYNIWANMIARCENPNKPNYGGKGITVCPRWRHNFLAFLEDMGERPNAKASIDRIDGNGNYEPENCRWASPKEQGRNRSNNRILTFNGKAQCVSAWEEEMGFPKGVIQYRLRQGWDVEKTLTTPVRKLSKRTIKQSHETDITGAIAP